MHRPPFPLPSFSLSLPLCVCSGEAVVAGWRRTWWPREEMLQEREREVVVEGWGGCFSFLLCSSAFPPLPTQFLASSSCILPFCLSPHLCAFFISTGSRLPSSILHPTLTFCPTSIPIPLMLSPLCSLVFFFFFKAIALLSVIKVLRLALREMCLLPLF